MASTLASHMSDEVRTTSSHLVTRSSIIDQELNQHGMGRYQWLIWSICGTGYFLDAMWSQALFLVISSIQRELGFSDKEFGNIPLTFFAGVSVGAFAWGTLVDIVGRRIAFFGTTFIAGVFGTCAGVISSYNGLLAVIALTGFGIGGNIPVDSTLAVEYLPKNRHYLLAALSFFLQVGNITSPIIAFAFIPNYSCSTSLESCRLTGGVMPCCSRNANMGWRYTLFTAGGITLVVFIIRFFVFPFHESPKFLLSKGDDRGAVEIVHKIATFNKCSCDLTVESLYEQSKESPESKETSFSKRLVREIFRFKLLLGSWRMARVTVLVWITWIFDYWGYGIAGAYFPAILQRKNIVIKVSLEQTFVDYLIVYIPSFAAVTLSVLMVRAPMIGRKWTLVFSSIFMSVSIFLYSTVDTQVRHVALNMLEFFFQSLFNATLFGWTPEAFPAAIRGTASGWAVFLATMLGIPASLIAELLFSSTNGSNAVLYMAGSGVLVSTLAVLCIPTKDMVAHG